MRTVKGFVCAAHFDGETLLYGPKSGARVGSELLRTNGFFMFPTRGQAVREAKSLGAAHEGGAAIRIGEAVARFIRSESDAAKFAESGGYFAVQIGLPPYGEGEMVLFGPSSGNGRGFDGREEAQFNGLKSFDLFADAQRVASELIRQTASGATVARIAFNWLS